MNEEDIRKRMTAVEELVVSDIAGIRTGRATSALVDDLKVAVYGGAQKLRVNELGTITTPDARTIIIEPWDKSIIGEIRKGIEAANIGLNPSIDGEIIRMVLPPITREDREKYIRLLHTKIENGKIMIRQIRGDVMKDIKELYEKKEISEDEKFNYEKRLQQITDEYVEKIEGVSKVKEEVLLQI